MGADSRERLARVETEIQAIHKLLDNHYAHLSARAERDIPRYGSAILMNATNVTAKINVSTASATGGATARLGLRCQRH